MRFSEQCARRFHSACVALIRNSATGEDLLHIMLNCNVMFPIDARNKSLQGIVRCVERIRKQFIEIALRETDISL